jgi:ribonuclease R
VSGAKVIAKKNIFPYDVKSMLQLGEQCSMTERSADEATREVVSWLKCEYLLERVGDEFDGQVSGVTGFGLFVELTDIYVEGLVHVTALKGDYYHYDPVKQRLQGERTGMSYHLGDRLRVRVIRVDLDDKKIDFELVGEHQTGRKMHRKSSKTVEQATQLRGTQTLDSKAPDSKGREKGKTKTGKGKYKAKFDSGDTKNTGAAKTKKKKSRRGKKKKSMKAAPPIAAPQVRKRDLPK